MFTTIWSKIKIIILTIVTIISISGFFIFRESHRIEVENIEELKVMDKAMKTSKDLNTSIVQIQQWLQDISATRAEDGYDDGFVEAEKSFNESLKLLDELKETAIIDDKEIVILKEKLLFFYEIGKKMASLYIKEGPKGGNQFMGTFDEASEGLQKALVPILDEITSKQIHSISGIQKSLSQMNTIIIFTFIGLIIFSLLALSFFGYKLVGAIKSKTFVLSGNIDNLLNNSENLNENASQLSTTVSGQASSLQETVSSIDEISSMVQRNADTANNSTKVSEKSAKAASVGKKKVEEMVDSINEMAKSNKDIMDEIQKSNEEMSRIVGVISEVGEKTKVINDIVFQTKLLSFNASVEAARAGEHGKGFAVVAEEVGNLAAMSGKAALEITTMVDGSINQVTDIVDKMKDKVDSLIARGKEKVEDGINKAKECDNSLEEILQNASSVNEMIREISSASTEQATGVKEVTRAMQSLDELTHKNSTIAAESSSMAKDLKEQADLFSHAVEDLLALIEKKK